MSQNQVRRLPEETTKLITSTQIVTSVGAAVKELIENSIDAGAKAIQVRLENYGLDLIEVKDDGSGVSYDNVQKMFLSGYTSKIREFEDLAHLNTYGFRGEALAAICKIAKVSITTKSKLDSLAMTYEIDSNGIPLSSKPSHLDKGSVVTITSLFSHLPVRRSFLSAKKKQSEELKKTEHIVQAMSLIHPELGMTLIHNKCPIWRKNSVKGVKQSFMQVVGLRTVSKMGYISRYFTNINLEMMVPKKNLDNTDGVFTNSLNGVYVYVNRRPVNCKILSRCLQEHIFHHFKSCNVSLRYAVCLVAVLLPPHEIDVNLEPDKSKILFKNQLELLKLIDDTLKNYYGHLDFTCKVLKEKDIPLSDDDDEEQEVEPQPKQSRLEAQTLNESARNQRAQESHKKDQMWDSETATDNSNSKGHSSADALPCSSKSLCSQINSSNSCLTREEVSEFNSILNETNHKFLVSKNSSSSSSGSSSGTSLTDRNDIHCRPIEKPILKEWPSRLRLAAPVQQTPEGSDSRSDESVGLPLEGIAEEMESHAQEERAGAVTAVEGGGRDGEGRSLNETALNEDVQQFDLSLQSVSSQLGRKDMKAFTKFARIMQTKITKEFPEMKHAQIARILADRWKALTPDEVKYYHQMADVVDDRRKTYRQIKTNPTPSPPLRKNNFVPMFQRPTNRSNILRPPRREISFPVSFDAVKHLRLTPAEDTNDSDYRIIGRLQPSGNWLYKRGTDIGHIRHQGLQELIVYQRMLSGFGVPRKPLKEPIPVNEHNMGSALWDVLMSLESERDPDSGKWAITSDVVVKNGFLVEMDKEGGVIRAVNITEAVESIPHFGISELKDSIELYRKHGEVGCLASCRPTAVCQYITNEAVRRSGQSREPPDREELEDLMKTYRANHKDLPAVCLHSREIFPPIYNLANETSHVQNSHLL